MRRGLVVIAVAVAAGAVVFAAIRAAGGPSGASDHIDTADVQRSEDNALRGQVTLRTEQPTTPEITLTSGDHTLAVTPTGEPATDHDIPLLGLRAEHDYTVTVGLRDAEGNEFGTSEIGTLTTGSLPEVFPPIEVDTADQEAMAPGLTLFNSIYRPPPGTEEEDGLEDTGFLQVVDSAGEVVWYHREHLDIQDARRMDNGDLLFISDETGARRITPTGEVVAEWRGTSPDTEPDERGEGLADGEVIDLDTSSMHHEIFELDNGNFVTLSRQVRQITYPEPFCEDGDGSGPSTEDVIGDSVVVFDPDTGEVIAEHSMFDILDPLDDPRKPDEDYCGDYLDDHFPDMEPRDWTHANGVIPIDGGDTWLVSLRQTDQLVAIRATNEPEGLAGTLRWTVGPDEDMELIGDGRWFWHQHAPELQDDGSILLYDNGNFRTDADEQYSRSVTYDIDPEAGTVEQLEQHTSNQDIYALFVGDADQLNGGTEGTELVTHGGQSIPCEATEDDDDTYVIGQIFEFDDATGDTVFELTTQDDQTCAGWVIYRAERIPTIYPPGYEVEVVKAE